MAAGPQELFEIANVKIQNGTIDWDNDTFGAMLLVDGYAKNLATQAFVSDVVAFENADGDYARQVIAGNVVSSVLTAGSATFDCDDIDFGDTVTIAARYLVIFRNVGTDPTNEVIFVCDLNTAGGNLSSSSGNFDIQINALGIHRVTPNQ